MLVKILEFGSSWWSKAGHDPDDPYRYTRRAAYYNSTAVSCGAKNQQLRHHWIVPGLVRFNGVGSFNPHCPGRAIGQVFCCDAITFALGGNRLLMNESIGRPEPPDDYLVVVSTGRFGSVELESRRWRSHGTRIVAISGLRDQQEAMLLMKPGGWVRTSAGVWQLYLSDHLQHGAALQLVSHGL
jgi:hypothetical protein